MHNLILGPLFSSPSFIRLFFFCPVTFDSSRSPSDVLLMAPHQEEEPEKEHPRILLNKDSV